MGYFFVRGKFLFGVWLLCLLLGGTLYHNEGIEEEITVEATRKEKEEVTIVIDPGHGGSDPGKVGVDGVMEKDINLKIAKQVDELLKELGIYVIMTRESDVSLGDQEGNQKKVTDLMTRVELINEVKPELVVSIHQNSYSSEKIKGAQVFYYEQSKEGEKAAKLMQEALLSLDGDNKREAKGNDTYYMLSRTAAPTIIVESGFLTNPTEAKNLVDEAYQKEVAEAIVDGIQSYLKSEMVIIE